MGLADVVEAEARRRFRLLGAGDDLVAQGLLEGVGDVAEGGLDVGVGRGSPWFGFWLAGQPNPLLGFADRPAAAGCIAGEAAADVVARNSEERLAVALAEVAGLEQLQRLVGQLEQADQVGDGGAAAADAAGELLFGQARGRGPGRRRRGPPRPG